MPAHPIRVFVVDDSPLMRATLCDVLVADARMQVVGHAGDGEEALRRLAQAEVDVVTLDVQMPGLDGLQTLSRLLEMRALPVVMVSAVTQRDASATLAALDLGAVDYVAKPDGVQRTRTDFARDLLHKVRIAAGADVQRILQVRRRRQQRPVPNAGAAASTIAKVGRTADVVLGLEQRCIVIGISTGGPPALARLFEALEPPLPPILVAQHMPEKFTGPFAARLNGLSKLEICEASEGDRVAANHALVAPGGKHLRVVRTPRGYEARIGDDPPVSGHRPSVDVLMTSAAEAYGDRCLGVIMTGMGHDGVEGCAAIRRAGGYVLGQDQATSDVYGMNKAAYRAGHVHEQFALGDLPELLTQLGRADGWAGRSAHICSH